MFYCDLCHKYLPKLNRGDPDELIDTHCVSTSHQDAYVKKQIEEQEALKALAEVCNLPFSSLFLTVYAQWRKRLIKGSF